MLPSPLCILYKWRRIWVVIERLSGFKPVQVTEDKEQLEGPGAVKPESRGHLTSSWISRHPRRRWDDYKCSFFFQSWIEWVELLFFVFSFFFCHHRTKSQWWGFWGNNIEETKIYIYFLFLLKVVVLCFNLTQFGCISSSFVSLCQPAAADSLLPILVKK